MALSILIAQVLLLALAAHAALIGAAAGAPIWRALPQEADNFELRAFFALALGLAIDIALIFVLGFCGLIYPFALTVVGLVAAAIAWALLRMRDFGWLKRLSGAEIGVALCFYVWVAAAAIKAPGFFDDTLYHLPLARSYAETHGLGLDPWIRFPLFPQNMEMLFTLALSLRPGDPLLAQGLAALPAFVVALGLIGAALWLRGFRLAGVAAGAIFLGLNVVDRTLGYAYIDDGLALFCFAAALGAILFAGSASVGIFAALGLLAGTACGSKIHALVFSALVFVLMAARRTPPRALAVFAATAALFGLGWYVRSFLISGDPVSPAGGPWLGYFLWDAADLAGQKEELATHGVGTALTRFPLAIIKAGANWLLIGLIAPILAWRDRVVWQLWALFVAYALFWFYATQVDRYLAPVLPIGALLTGIFLADLTRLTARIAPSGVSGRLRRPEISLVLATALLAIFVNDALTRAGKEARGWNRILAERQGFLAMQAANAARPRDGARMVQIGLDNARYFYDGELIGDWFGPGRYRQFWVEPDKHLISSSEMRSALQRFDARLLAISPVFKYDAADYARDFDVLMKDQNQTLLQLKAAP